MAKTRHQHFKTVTNIRHQYRCRFLFHRRHPSTSLIKPFSLDTPSGTGDHENYFDFDQEEPVCEANGVCYKECFRRAVHIREIETQVPWYGSRENTLIFSDSTKMITKFYKSLEKMKDALKSIDFKRVVNSTYG